MPEVFLSPTGYKKFIIAFRNACHGRPVGTVEYTYTHTNGTDTSVFRFNTENEYLVGVKYKNNAWRVITDNEGHYSHMGTKPKKVTRQAVVSAMETDFTQPISTWKSKLFTVICVTAESARSEVVYRDCQLAMHTGGELNYTKLWPYINSYGKNRINEGIGGKVFQPLKDSQYRVKV